jgi:hypothetical protein
MNDSDLQELLDKVVAGRLTPEEEQRWNRLLAQRPELEEELALAEAIRALPSPPPVSSNFTSLVMQEIRRAEASEKRAARPLWPRLIRLAAAAVVLALGAFTFVQHQEVKQAQQAADILSANIKAAQALAATVKAVKNTPDAETENALSVFRDFEAIRQLPPNTPGVDDGFLSAFNK